MIQRVRVGLTGLAVVILLILATAAIYRSASSDAPSVAIGAPKPEVVANMTAEPAENEQAVPNPDDPLAELGVAPTSKTPAPVASPTPLPTAR